MEKKQTYSESYARLQEILSEIESGRLDIDELSIKIKEATGLLKACKEKLFVADEEVKKALDEMNGGEG